MRDSAYPVWSGASAKVWGLVFGFPEARRKKRPLWMLKAVVDDSGRGQPPVFVLAGFLAPAQRWAAFADEWDAALKAEPAVEYFKMKEAANFNKQFSRWSADSRDMKVELLVPIIEKHVDQGFACVIDLQAYEDVFAGGYHEILRGPYHLAVCGVIGLVMSLLESGKIDDKVDFIFDEQGKELGKALSTWNQIKDSCPPEVRLRFGDPPISRSDTDFNPLQAADFLAWQVRRQFLENQGRHSGSIFLDTRRYNTSSIEITSQYYDKRFLTEVRDGARNDFLEGLEPELCASLTSFWDQQNR